MSARRPAVTRVRFLPASEPTDGLLGWACCEYGDLRLDGLAVRRTRAGELRLSFPERTDAKGHRHPVVRPLDDRARREIERLVFLALGLEEGAS